MNAKVCTLGRCIHATPAENNDKRHRRRNNLFVENVMNGFVRQHSYEVVAVVVVVVVAGLRFIIIAVFCCRCSFYNSSWIIYHMSTDLDYFRCCCFCCFCRFWKTDCGFAQSVAICAFSYIQVGIK